MKKILFTFMACVFLNGCIPVLIGAGLVTGYALSNDSASGNLKVDYRQLWDACMTQMENNDCEIIHADESRGLIKAHQYDKSIIIKINSLSAKTQHLKVSSRRNMLPNPQTAQKIFFDIVGKFESGQD